MINVLWLLGLLAMMGPASGSESIVSDPLPIACTTRGVDLPANRPVILCPANCTQWRVSVFGTGVFASVSGLCAAAVHRGAIQSALGGRVKVQRLPGRHHYMSSYSHGVQSQSLARWTASFSVEGAQEPLELSSKTKATALPATGPGKPLKKFVKKVPSVGNKDCQMEIAVLLDGSRNIGQRRFNLQKSFASKLAIVLRVGTNGPHLGVVQASDDPKTEIFLTNYTQPKDLVYAMKEIQYLGGNTNTGKAIRHTVETFFTVEAGLRRGHPQVIVVLVDGWPSDDLEAAATLARESGINVFLVSAARASPEELGLVPDKDFTRKAVCRDNTFFSLNMPSWFSTTKHVKPLSQRLCSKDLLVCSKTCYNAINLGFLIDGSSSVGYANFRLVLDFLVAIVRRFDVSDVGARIGAVQFTYDQKLEFGLQDHPSKDATIKALQEIYYMSGGTATGDALSFTTQTLFKPRKTGYRDFLIVITDGQSYDDVSRPALAAQKEGITIFSVGVAWAPIEDVRSMASEPKDSHTYFTKEFTGLEDFTNKIVHQICRDFNEAA